MKGRSQDSFTEHRVFLGVDHGSKNHVICLLDADGVTRHTDSIEHSGTGLFKVLRRLDEILEKLALDWTTVAVASETPHGATVEALAERCAAIYSINPKQLDRHRDRFSASGAKDDRRDAYVLAEALRTERLRVEAERRAGVAIGVRARESFRLVTPTGRQQLALRELSRADQEIGELFRAQSNRLRQQLERYFPQLLKVSPAANDPFLWDLLERAPFPAAAARLQFATLRKVLKTHRIRRIDGSDLQALLKEPALPVAPGVAEAAVRHIALLIPQLRLLYQQRAALENELESLLKAMTEAPETSDCISSGSAPAAAAEESRTQLSQDLDDHVDDSTLSSHSDASRSDAAIVLSIPGIGTRIAGVMLSDAANEISTADYAALRAHSGAAPVTRMSGNSRIVQIRRACSTRLRNAIHQMAGCAIAKDEYCNQLYRRLRDKGHKHAHALRILADRMLHRLCAMLRTRTLWNSDLAAASVRSAA